MVSRLFTLLCLLTTVTTVTAQEFLKHSFHRQTLSDVYYSEGIAAGDLDGDRTTDIVCGPWWYQGPGYTSKHEIYPAVPQDRNGYADNFSAGYTTSTMMAGMTYWSSGSRGHPALFIAIQAAMA
jgi:hypothetical protein